MAPRRPTTFAADFGLLQPITVRRTGDRYEIIGGHRRFAAYQILAERHDEDVQWRTIPAVIAADLNDERAYLALLTSQVQIESWKPREQASALERLVQRGLSVKEVAQTVHKSEAWASTRLRIYADSVLSGYVQAGRLRPAVAQELLLTRDPDTRREMAENAADEDWSQDYARGQVRALRIDRQSSHLGRQAKDMLEVLSTAQATDLVPKDARVLWQLANRIYHLATGQQPKFPTIEAAIKAAGVTSEAPRRRTKIKVA